MLLTSTLLSCAPTADLEVTAQKCKIDLEANVTNALVFDRQIAFQNENTEIFHFDLTANQFVCAQDKDMRLLQKFQGEKAKTVYLSASELHQNIKNVNFSQSAATGLSTTEYAENFCKNIGFYYIFGISDQGSEVIGCQPSELTQSAIMFKKTSENKAPVTIAAMGIYTPIINKQLNSSE